MKNQKSSFTIIELLMALGVFTFVVLSALGIYTTTIQKHYEAQKIQLVVEELRWPMELMAKDIKEGILMWSKSNNEIYIASKRIGLDNFNKCLAGNKSNCLIYKINLSDINNSRIEVSFNGGATYLQMTSSKIQILSGSQFKLPSNLSNNPSKNPMVTILIKAKATNDPKEISQITLQTTVNQNSPENHYQGSLP